MGDEQHSGEKQMFLLGCTKTLCAAIEDTESRKHIHCFQLCARRDANFLTHVHLTG